MAPADDAAPAPEMPRRLALAVGALGLSCVMTQLALLRELFAAFSGNEMVLGVTLGLWLLLMGLGAGLGRGSVKLRQPGAALVLLQVLIALLPVAQVFLLRALRNVVFLRGAAVGVSGTVMATAVLLLPYCLLAGFGLTLACAILARSAGPAAVGRVYVADSVGSVLGGILFTFVLVRFLDHIGILLFAGLVNLGAALLLWLGTKRDVRVSNAPTSAGGAEYHSATRPVEHARDTGLPAVALGLGASLLGAGLFLHLDARSTACQYSGRHVVARANSPYGRWIVTESAGQFDLIENGLPITSSRDDQRVEETVHYPLTQRPRARAVLLVSGGISGTAAEILKYPGPAVDYVELDPQMLELGRKYLPQNLADPRIRTVYSDGRSFIAQSAAKYDVIILDLPPPSTAQLNRFYTVEFFAQAKRALTREGVISFSLGRYENYVSPELARMLASARASLARSFRHVLLLPGGRVCFLASDGPLTPDIATQLEASGVTPRLVNRHYLDATLTPDRLAAMSAASDPPADLNRDFSPILYYHHLRHWLSQFEPGSALAPALLLLVLGGYLVRLRGAAVVLVASGFAASALEVVLLLAFQVLCGSVYHQVGVIVTLFMAGLAIGAWLVNRRTPGLVPEAASASPKEEQAGSDPTPNQATLRRSLALSAFAIAAYALALPLVLPLLGRWNGDGASWLGVKLMVGLLTLLLALLVGLQFPLANRLEFARSSTSAARLYTADFVGACLGALLASTLLIPLIGVAGTALVTAGLNMIGGSVALVRGR